MLAKRCSLVFLSLLFTLSFVSAFSFQGLFTGKVTDDSNSSIVACADIYSPVCGADGQTYSNGCYAKRAGVTSFTEGECKKIGCTTAMPYCPEGEIVYSGASEAGCPIYKCINKCPSMSTPVCEDGYEMVGYTDSNGCSLVKCQQVCPKVVAPNNNTICGSTNGVPVPVYNGTCITGYKCEASVPSCPSVAMPICEGGYEIQYYKNEQGCKMARCIISEPIACPSIAKPNCADNEIVEIYYDSNGCSLVKCSAKIATGCTAAMPYCLGGEYRLVGSENSCPKYECINKTILKNDTTSCENGCLSLDGKTCYPAGYRRANTYCDAETWSFVDERFAAATCENNFECSSNLCVSGQCVDEGLWRKFTAWLNNLFG